jgi:hypothetical protein
LPTSRLPALLRCPLFNECSKKSEYNKSIGLARRDIAQFTALHPEKAWAFLGYCPHKFSEVIGGDLVPKELWLNYQKCATYCKLQTTQTVKIQRGGAHGRSRFIC